MPMEKKVEVHESTILAKMLDKAAEMHMWQKDHNTIGKIVVCSSWGASNPH